MATSTEHKVRAELVDRGLLVEVAALHPHPSNPRRGDVKAIAGSLERFGQMRPIIATQDGTIVAGNHTYQAALSLGWTHIAATLMEMTAKDEAAYLIADNRHSDMATYDDAALLEHLHVLAADDNLAGVGFEQDDISGLADALAALPDEPLPDEEPAEPGEEDDEAVPRGSKLALVDVSIAEPVTQLARGDVVRLGRHLLYVEPVFTGHSVWGAALAEDPDRVFVPYPQPTVPLTDRANTGAELVMVQPDRYLAGHLVDKWVSVNGDSDVEIIRGEA